MVIRTGKEKMKCQKCYREGVLKEFRTFSYWYCPKCKIEIKSTSTKKTDDIILTIPDAFTYNITGFDYADKNGRGGSVLTPEALEEAAKSITDSFGTVPVPIIPAPSIGDIILDDTDLIIDGTDNSKTNTITIPYSCKYI